MKIAVLLGAFSIGTRPLDFANLWTSGRGLTGTDLCFVRTCQELEKLGHEVDPWTGFTNRGSWEKLRDVRSWEARSKGGDYDAVVSINEPNLLIGVPPWTKRVVWQMLNDFSFVAPGFDDWVDQYFGVCEQHTKYVAAQCPHPEKWGTVGLGCDPELYEDKRVPGRVVYTSSPDRGLHWLLSVWPAIRAAVPAAHLRIFYHWSHDSLLELDERSVSPQGGPYDRTTLEVAQRMRYVKHAVEALRPLGVEHVGSVSRERMAMELSEANVLAYPCDTVAFSEGFSVSILEAHASRAVPVITDCDCLGSVYKHSGAYVTKSPVGQNLDTFTAQVIGALREPDGQAEQRLSFADGHTWAKSVAQLDKHLRSA